MTTEEKVWLKKLQKVLDACPSDRIGLYTTGDPYVSVYDRSKETEINQTMDRHNGMEFGNAVDEHDARLGYLKFPAGVYSTAG